MSDDLVKRLASVRTAETPDDFRKWVEDWARDSSEAATRIQELEAEVKQLEQDKEWLTIRAARLKQGE